MNPAAHCTAAAAATVMPTTQPSRDPPARDCLHLGAGIIMAEQLAPFFFCLPGGWWSGGGGAGGRLLVVVSMLRLQAPEG